MTMSQDHFSRRKSEIRSKIKDLEEQRTLMVRWHEDMDREITRLQDQLERLEEDYRRQQMRP